MLSIEEKSTLANDLGGNSKTDLRKEFLAGCNEVTKRLQKPIVDIAQVNGRLNPSGLGHAKRFSNKGSIGQSSVAFETLAEYLHADKLGKSSFGGAEYGIVQSPEADAVCRKFSELHNGTGAIICASGLSAITTTIDAFSPKAIIIPENIYFPARRYMMETGRVQMHAYPSGASGGDVARVMSDVTKIYKPQDVMVYVEAPGSGTFEIPDIKGTVQAAQKQGIRTVMDNTWASHVRFKPLDHGIDVVIQATTKYEGGYGDTPSGVVIARSEEDASRLKRQLRISGNGAVSPQTCMRLFHRVDSTKKRLDRHASTAQKLMQWFDSKPFVSRIISPAWKDDPNYPRFKEYFGKGNGLFTVAFDEKIPDVQVRAFVDALHLPRIAEGWGGHISLVLPVGTKHRARDDLPKGRMLRFHAGLEDARDLIKDLEQASRVFARKDLFFSAKPAPRP